MFCALSIAGLHCTKLFDHIYFMNESIIEKLSMLNNVYFKMTDPNPKKSYVVFCTVDTRDNIAF